MRRALIVVALALLVCVSGCSPSTSTDGALTRVAVDKRQAAPVLSGTDLDGKPLSTASFSGKVVVINVWGSWCAPCRHEAPVLVAVAAETAGVAQFVGINTRDLDPAPARAFVRNFAITYPSFYDPDGALLVRLSGQVPPNAVPTTLILDRQGRVAARVIGETTQATLTGLIGDIAAGK